MKEEELWKDISGYEGLYQISSLGRIKTSRTDSFLSLKPHKTKRYSVCALYDKDRKGKPFSVHRIVAAHFLQPPTNPKQTCVNHINGIKSDNRVSNLEWTTHSENVQHAYDTGLMTPTHGASKLKIDDAISIKKILAYGFPVSFVAKLYDMSTTQINSVKKRGWKGIRQSYKISSIGLALIILLSSCSAASKLRRAKRLIASAETSGATVVSDTVFTDRVVYVPEMRIDTVFQKVDFRDTLVITKDRVVTRIKIDPVEKKVYVKTVCPPDTIKIKVPVVVNRTISAGYTGWRLTWMTGLGWLIGFIMGTFLGRFVLKLIV